MNTLAIEASRPRYSFAYWLADAGFVCFPGVLVVVACAADELSFLGPLRCDRNENVLPR